MVHHFNWGNSGGNGFFYFPKYSKVLNHCFINIAFLTELFISKIKWFHPIFISSITTPLKFLMCQIMPFGFSFTIIHKLTENKISVAEATAFSTISPIVHNTDCNCQSLINAPGYMRGTLLFLLTKNGPFTVFCYCIFVILLQIIGNDVISDAINMITLNTIRNHYDT